MSDNRLLTILKRRGSADAADLAADLGISPQAVRQNLARLETRGLVDAEAVTGQVGRPRKLWSLTEEGHRQFPDGHAHALVEMIEATQQSFGDEGLDRLIAHREENQKRRYREALGAATDLEDKLQSLARLRTSEGYLAETQADGDGFLLIENHCPICAAATICQGFCRSELSLFREVLGPGVTVERAEHLFAGSHRCVYRVAPVTE